MQSKKKLKSNLTFRKAVSSGQSVRDAILKHGMKAT
jgi:hypothetical protein